MAVLTENTTKSLIFNNQGSLIWTPPVLQVIRAVAFEIWLQSYIRPFVQTISLLALMEFAERVLIS